MLVDYDPHDGWCMVSTGFQPDKGIILGGVRPQHIGHRSRKSSLGYANSRWG